MTTISITYDQAISPTTVSTQTFAVHAMQTGLLTQTYGVRGGTIVLTPTQPLKPDLVQCGDLDVGFAGENAGCGEEDCGQNGTPSELRLLDHK